MVLMLFCIKIHPIEIKIYGVETKNLALGLDFLAIKPYFYQ